VKILTVLITVAVLSAVGAAMTLTTSGLAFAQPGAAAR
jgi:hypothetical protein